MRKDVQVGVEIDDLGRANQLMVEYGRGFLPIISEEGTLLSVVFKKDRDKHLRHPQESVDESRRLQDVLQEHPVARQIVDDQYGRRARVPIERCVQYFSALEVSHSPRWPRAV